jgi:DNA-binding NtrC family response regulator
MREILEALLTREGYSACGSPPTAAEGLELARRLPFDAAIVDVMMPGIDGIATLEELKKLDEDLPVIMITAFASVENAIAAMKRGAFDYITKPFKNDEVWSSCATPWSAPAGGREPRAAAEPAGATTRPLSGTSSAAASACGRCST